MIFAAVGTQLPFDRFVKCIDNWAVDNPGIEVIVQTGDSNFIPRAVKAFDFIEPKTFAHHQSEAEIMVGHCGMGTILAALELRKPVIVMPRLSDRGEHRNNHQLATALHFKDRPGIYVAFSESELVELLEHRDTLKADANALQASASPELLAAVQMFIEAS